MSHGITSTDGLVLAGKPAWHRLGLVVEDAPDVDQALILAGLDWKVEKRQVWFGEAGDVEGQPTGTMLPATDCYINVRKDTCTVLGPVGPAYVPFQNRQLAEMAKALEGHPGTNGSTVKVESAGSLHGGRTVFFLVRTGEFGVGISGADKVQTFGLFTTSHDASAAIRAHGTSVRVVCANTLAMASSGAKARDGFTIRHTAALADRVASAMQALAGIQVAAVDFQTKATALANKGLNQTEQQEFFLGLYQSEYGKIPAGEWSGLTREEQRKKRKATEIVGTWLAKLEDSNQTLDGIQGTAWAALNSVTEWADHQRTVRKTKRAENAEAARLASNLFGSSDSFKREALTRALATV